MSSAQKLMTVEAFFAWCETQEDTYELVDGVPVAKYRDSAEAMAGTTRDHARISSNLVFALRLRLRGGPCVALNDNLSVRTSTRKLRRPDVVVECGQGLGSDLEASEPTVLFEVLSRSSERNDLIWKPEEYKSIATVRHYVVVDPGAALLKVWTRDADGRWSDGIVEGLDAVLDLAAVEVELPMREIYEGVAFAPRA